MSKQIEVEEYDNHSAKVHAQRSTPHQGAKAVASGEPGVPGSHPHPNDAAPAEPEAPAES